MILIYFRNQEKDEVADVISRFDGERIGYRNPEKWKGEVEACDKVYIHGDYPKLKEAYGDKVISKQYPIEKGAGWYELSNGSSVRGEEEALQKQAEIDGYIL